MRRLLGTLAVLVACAGTPALAADPSPSPSPSPTAEAPVELRVSKLAPRAPMPTDGFFQVRGTLINRSAQPLHALRVRLRRGGVMRSRGELDRADHEPPGTPVLVGATVPTVQPDLAPGASTAFDIRLPLSELRLSSLGVYPLKVEARGRIGDAGDDSLGAVSTYVPWFPDGAPRGKTRIAWLWPVVGQPRRTPAEVMLDQVLEREVSARGRLETLVRAAAVGQKGGCDAPAQLPPDAPAVTPPVAAPATPCRPTPVPVTYAVDPDLLVDAAALAARPYKVLDPGNKPRTVDATAVFTSWLAALRAAVAGGDLLALPYADPDVVALTNPDVGLADEVARLAQLGDSEAKAITGATPVGTVVWPPPGRLTRAALEALTTRGAEAAVLDPAAVTGRDIDTNRTPDTHVGQLLQATGAAVNGLVVDPVLSGLVGRVDTGRIGPRLTEQRWLAETAMIAAEAPSVSRTLVVAPPRRGTVSASVGAAVIADSGRLPWLCAVPLTAVAVGSQACPGEVVQPPKEQEAAELEPPVAGDPLLSPRFLRHVRSARAASTQFTEQVLEPGEPARQAAARLLRARARTESSAWRDTPAGGERMLSLLNADLRYLRDKVHLQIGQRTVTLTSRTGTISVNVVNELAQPVRVGVALRTANSARLSLESLPVETIAPASSVQISLKVTSATSGKFEVKAQLVDRTKRPFGSERTLVVRSTQYGRVALAVTGVGAGVLLLAAGLRITRRALRRR